MLLLLQFCLPAVSDYRQSLQFKNLNAEKQNIQLEVCKIILLSQITHHVEVKLIMNSLTRYRSLEVVEQ